MKFTPTKSFWSADTKSQYEQGLSYTVRPGNEKLAKLVAKWATEGKVVTFATDPTRSEVGGIGQVN